MREGSNVSFLYVEIQFSQHNLLKRLFFPPLKGVDVLAENKLIIYVRIFFFPRLATLEHWFVYPKICQYHTVLITVVFLKEEV